MGSVRVGLRGAQVSDQRRVVRFQALDEIGFNDRLSNVAAAIGVIQMQRLDGLIERRRAVAARYRDELADQSERLDELRRRAASGPLTIVYAARDRDHNNAVVLTELLRDG